MTPILPVTLEGDLVRLEPLELRHAQGLAPTCDAQTFRYFATWGGSTDVAEVAAEIERMSAVPTSVSFAVIERATNEIIGSSAFLDIRPEHHALEIGRTWIIPRCRGSKINPEMKYLMLRHAFETPLFTHSMRPAERVQLKTDSRNIQSRHAIARLGAMREGVLRKHMLASDGVQRDTVMYSIIRDEWPAVRDGLLHRLRG